MAIFDIFKKPKEQAKKTEKKKAPKKRPAVKIEEPAVKLQPKAASLKPAKPKKVSEIAYRTLKGPHVTEKASDAISNNQYIFEVYPRANKNDIKKSVEDLYGVAVVSVKIINIHAKKKRLGMTQGWKSGYKKAIIKLAAGHKIEVLPR